VTSTSPVNKNIKINPTISVILPTYNRAKLINRSINSVLNQTYTEFELIIIDDGSVDFTEAIINKIEDSRILYLRHEKNCGAAAARNTGLKIARGEFVAFQDSDDMWMPEKLEKQIRAILEAPSEVGVVYTDMLRIDTNGQNYYWHSPEITSGSLINTNTLCYQVGNLGIVSMLIRKACLEEIGYFDERLPRFIDMDLCMRLSKKFKFKHIREPLVKYCMTEGISTNSAATIIAEKLLLQKYYDDIKNNRKFLDSRYSYIARLLRSTGQIKDSRNYLIMAIKINPLNIKNIIYLILSYMRTSL